MGYASQQQRMIAADSNGRQVGR
eukprot:SAG22_NODE_12314_length_447_cov_1.043103_1_plen_22_part_10